MTCSRCEYRRRGFTLLELVITLTLIVIATGTFLGGSRPNPHHLTGNVAREIRASMQYALAEAEAIGGEAVFYVDVADVADQRGKFLAIAGPAGIDSFALNHGWIPLGDGVQWADGMANTDPFGAAAGRIPVEVRCRGRQCWLGGADYVAYYIGHLRNARAVHAVVLTRDGALQLFRYNSAAARWDRAAT